MPSNQAPHPLEVAISLSEQSAINVAKKFGTVVPFGIAVVQPDNAPQTHFVREKYPDLDYGGLVEKVIEELRARVLVGDVQATVAVSEVQSAEGQRGFATQIESVSGISLLIYPYHFDEGEVVVGEPIYEEGRIMFGSTFGGE